MALDGGSDWWIDLYRLFYLCNPGPRVKGEVVSAWPQFLAQCQMSTAPLCEGCRGKFPLLAPGGLECEVCSAFHRVRNLVWGTRFPPQLSATASRVLHNSYLQLLQEADLFYFQQPQKEVELRPWESKGSSPPAPGKTPDRKRKSASRKREKRKKKDKDKSPGRGDRKRERREVKEEPREIAEPKKERKSHRREEGEAAGKKKDRVKEERVEEGRENLVDVKEEEESWIEEEAESEPETADEASPSKSPLPRRRPPASPPRPVSPAGPPPEAGRDTAPPRQWEGVIPGRFRGPDRHASGSDQPPGLAPKIKATKRKKKNKGVKHRERQERRREEREHRRR